MAWGLLAALTLLAQQPGPPTTSDALLDRIAEAAISVARANAGAARLPDGSPIPTATAEDRARFAIPAALERQTVHRGLLTGQLEHCARTGIARSFRPYMAQLRRSGRYSEHQLGYVAILHGVSQGIAMDGMDSPEAPRCTEEFRAGVNAAVENFRVETP